jgi:hypothetical protein
MCFIKMWLYNYLIHKNLAKREMIAIFVAKEDGKIVWINSVTHILMFNLLKTKTYEKETFNYSITGNSVGNGSDGTWF